MNAKLSLLQMRMDRQSPGSSPTPASDDLAAAIERLIEQRVDDAVAQAKPPAHVQQLLDRQFSKPAAPCTEYRQLPAIPTAAPKKPMRMLWHRDGAGRVLWVEFDGVKLEVMRDAAGLILGARQIDESPVLPALDIAHKAAARQYKPGEPR